MPDKGISSIAYNYLNLPTQITQTAGNTSYVYRADGLKIKKVFGTKTTDYLDGFQYVNGVLQFVPTAECYYDFTKSRYVYNYTDHLGNVRISLYKDGSTATILEENNYYPFGLKHEGYNDYAGTPAYQYKYNGKELQENGMYDYGARFYMPEMGRFGTIDPSSQYTHEAYSYVWNNPLFFTDPTGMTGEEFATCPTCPNTSEFKKYIDDPNHTYVFDPKTKTVEEERSIQEVVITAYRAIKSASSAATITTVGLSESIWASASSTLSEIGSAAFTVGRLSLWALPLMLNGDSNSPRPVLIPPPPVLNTETDDGTDVNGVNVPNEGKLEKSPTGKGTVPPAERDPKRVPTAKEKREMWKENDEKCANCGQKNTIRKNKISSLSKKMVRWGK